MINLDANFPSRSHNGAKVLVQRYILHPRESFGRTGNQPDLFVTLSALRLRRGTSNLAVDRASRVQSGKRDEPSRVHER
jgi:hypothetical protein